MASTTELRAKIGVLLSSNTEVIQIILHQLSLLELSRLQRVCRLWRTLAAKEIASRHQLQLLVTSDSEDCLWTKLDVKENKKALKRWRHGWQSKPHLCLCFRDPAPEGLLRMKNYLPETCSIVEVPCHEAIIGTNELASRDFLSFGVTRSMCRSSTCPNLAISSQNSAKDGVFGSDGSNKSEESSPPSKRSKMYTARKARLDKIHAKSSQGAYAGTSTSSTSYGDNHLEMLAQKCSLCAQMLRANVGRTSVIETENTRRLNCKKLDKMAVLCLPQLPNVTYLLLDAALSSQSLGAKERYKTWDGCIPDTHRPKAILAFHNQPTGLHPYIKGILMREEGRVAVAGGMYDNVCLQSARPCADMFGVAVCGEGVTAATTVLKQDVVAEEDVLKALKQFEQLYNPRKQSVAFFITCIGRSAGELEQDLAWEVDHFRKLYPTTSVFGTFVYGETCHKFFPYNRSSKEWDLQEMQLTKGLTSGRFRFQYAYSTVILFLQFS